MISQGIGKDWYMCHKRVRPSLKRRLPARIAVHCATFLVLVWGGATGALLAQDTNGQAAQPMSGPQIRTVSGYAVYYSSFLPNGGSGSIQAGSANLPADGGGGGNIEFAWTKFSERSTFSLNYTPSYTGYWRNSSLNAFNHAFSLNATRKLAPRWTLGFSAAGDLSSLEQSMFSPTTLSNVASARATFDDLAAAMLSAKFANNPQLGAILTSSPLVDSPVRNLLYGQRMLTSSGHVSLSYSYSPRLSITVSGGGGRQQHVSADQLGGGNTSLIANTTSGNASVAVSYSLSPFTQVGGTLTTTRTASALQDSYTTTSQATLGRTLGMRWFLQIHGGMGVTNPARQSAFNISTKPRPVLGGSLGYKTFAHTFLGSYDRTVSDSYGLGATTNSSAAASWRWGRPGGAWWLDSSFSWQRLEGGTAIANTSGWRTTVGLNRAIGTHLVWLTQYAHLNSSGGLQAAAYQLSQDGVRVSMVWIPHPAALQ
jgi:hypothetical protein